MSIFNASTPVNVANLNKLMGGDGTIQGLQMFSLYLSITNPSGTMKYVLYTNSQNGNWRNLSDIGATEITSPANMGDGNVNRNAAGDYEITGLNSMANLFVLGQMKYCTDSNIVYILVQGDHNSDKIIIRSHNNAGINTEIASDKRFDVNLIGFFN